MNNHDTAVEHQPLARLLAPLRTRWPSLTPPALAGLVRALVRCIDYHGAHQLAIHSAEHPALLGDIAC